MISKSLWQLALVTEFWGFTAALLGLIGYLAATSNTNRRTSTRTHVELLCLFTLSYLKLGFALFWDWSGQPAWALLSLTATNLSLVTISAYFNLLILARVVHISGGVTGLFTPLFVLVPHATAIFLDGTAYYFNVYVILVLTPIIYFYTYLRAPVRKITAPRLYAFWSAFLLVATIILQIYLVQSSHHTTA